MCARCLAIKASLLINFFFLLCFLLFRIHDVDYDDKKDKPLKTTTKNYTLMPSEFLNLLSKNKKQEKEVWYFCFLFISLALGFFCCISKS